MKVKAKTNINYGGGWIHSGEVFEAADSDLPMLGGMVEVLDKKPAPQPAPEPVKEPEQAANAEPEKEPAKPKTTTRRKKIS